MMTPQDLLSHSDSGQLWSESPSAAAGFDVPSAYQRALAVRSMRIARGELPRGFKIGFTNRNIWPRYRVYAPIWGTVYDSTLAFCDGDGTVSLAGSCQPRIEPEAVFGMKSRPVADASMEDLFQAIDWVAPGFEIVQSHLPDWKFKAADSIADGGLHARLLVGKRVAMGELARSSDELDERLAATQVSLFQDDRIVDKGHGANVLDSPLRALHYFLQELRLCPGAPDLLPGDVVTTGTWTDAWPVQPGQRWSGVFSSPLSSLRVKFV